MLSQKVDNILSFTILFHKVADGSFFMSCDGKYILEKYNAIIGTDPIIRDSETSDWWQNVVIKDPAAMKLKIDWLSKWNKGITNKIDPKTERILNYLCSSNIIDMTPSNILNTYEKYIGSVNDVKDGCYQHLHPLFKKFVEDYKIKHQRELNLELLKL